MTEAWRDIKDYENLYQVSNFGNVRSIDRVIKQYNYSAKKDKIYIYKGKILTQGIDRNHYARVVLSKNNKQKHFMVHRLVAEAFIPNSNNLPYINHKDENSLNNVCTNLEWCTQKYNINYGTRTLRMRKTQGKKVKCVETGIVYDSISEANKKNNCFHIKDCLKGRRKTSGGYHWEYERMN